MENLDKVLGICCVCRKIRINNEWLKEQDNPELYGRFIKKYEGRLSHGYCPEHKKAAMEEDDKSRNDNWPLEIPENYFK